MCPKMGRLTRYLTDRLHFVRLYDICETNNVALVINADTGLFSQTFK